MKLSQIYKLWLMTLLASTWIFVLTGCNHLMYPAVREPYMSKKFLVPPPEEVIIYIPQTENKSYLHAWYFPAQSEIKKGLSSTFMETVKISQLTLIFSNG